MDIWGTEVAVLPAGTYDLFAAHFPDGVGRFGLYVPAPDECALASFTVDGDTTVDLPDLGPCDLGPLSGSPEEIARRVAPPEPTGPGGTAEVVLSEYAREGGGEGRLVIVVLEQGTSLDEIGLGEAWPVGFGCLHVPPWEHLDPNVRRLVSSDGIPIPIIRYPAAPGAAEGFCVGPNELLMRGFHPDPVELRAAAYDVYVSLEMEDESGWENRCGRATATVSGLTRIDLPPLEDCS
jgi:hypothetical protein